MTTAAAVVMAASSDSSPAEASTWPKARICAAAHSTDPGIMMMAASRATPSL
jgi:hypothetical protein